MKTKEHLNQKYAHGPVNLYDIYLEGYQDCKKDNEDGFRREAAKDILCAMLGRVERFYTGVSIDGKNKISHQKDFIKLAIEDADELIKQLKEEKL